MNCDCGFSSLGVAIGSANDGDPCAVAVNDEAGMDSVCGELTEPIKLDVRARPPKRWLPSLTLCSRLLLYLTRSILFRF